MSDQQNMPERSTKPPQQESATVAAMRATVASFYPHESADIKAATVNRWADTLEAAEQTARDLSEDNAALQARLDGCQANARRIALEYAELEQQAVEMQVPVAFGQQCYQDRCENAYVEASVVKMLEEEVASLKAQLESRQPAPSQELEAGK